MMNILQQEDIVKGLPDQALMQEAQMPSGQVPQYLVVSEIQRRSDMRKRYKAEQGQMPQGTVKEKVMQEGIMASMPPQMAMAPQMAQRMPNMPPPQMPPQGIEQAMPTQMMSGGGIVRMANGGRTQEILDLVAVGLSPLQITQKGYEQAEIEAAINEYNQRMTASFDTPDYVGGPMREIEDAPKRPASGTQYDPPIIPGVTDKVTEFVTETAPDAAREFIQAGDMARARTGVYGGVNTDFFTPAQRESASELIDDAGESLAGTVRGGLEGIYDSLARSRYGKTLALIPDLIFGDDSAESIQDQNKRLGLGPRGPSGFLMRSEPPVTVGDVSQSGIATAVGSDGSEKQVTGEAGGKERAGGGAEVQSDSVFGADDYRSRLEYLMSLGVDSDKEIEIPTLDYSDIRADLDRRTKSNMLFRLAEGIGKGDVASGIGGMSKVAEEAARDISKIDIAERKGQFDAATAAQKRQDSLIKTQRTLGAELMGLSDKLRLDESVNKRAIINYYADIREGLQDELVALAQFEGSLSPESAALMRQIDRMLQDLGKEYGIELPEIDKGGVDRNPAGLNLPSRQAAP